MLCTTCREFQGLYPISSRDDPGVQLGQARHHSASSLNWKGLISSAKQCYCCKIILDGCQGVFASREVKEAEIDPFSLHFSYPKFSEDADEANCDKILKFRLKSGQIFEIEIFCAEDDETPVPDSWDYLPTFARTSSATDSDEAMEKIDAWVTACIEEDENCRTDETPELPKRVVDVGLEDGIVKLIETEGENEKYICLSHCWGLEQIITTKIATIESRKKNIPWDELSKTFQDAITLTRNLGFNYIWIDSLCIIQDSAEDWAIESAKMASVYSNGYLTIAGTKSSSGRGGLFSTTPDVRIAGQTPDGEEYAVYFRQRIDHHLDVILDALGMTPTEKYYPLLSRAWVYQERMLSTRVLHFSHYELFFECKTEVDCECGRIRVQGLSDEDPMPLVKIEYADALADYGTGYKGRARKRIEYNGARLWRTMVSCYTALKLTKSKDRLPAFGGLAKQMSNVRTSRYLAGLWEDSLHDDLLWNVFNTDKLKYPRPEPRNAPSWSWASIECVAGVDYRDSKLFTEPEVDGYEDQAPHTHFSTIESCEIVMTAVDEFGPIEKGSLTISGLVVECTVEREEKVDHEDARSMHYVVLKDSRLPFDPDYVLEYDDANQVKSGSSALCLRMSLLHQDQRDYFISLVLRKSITSPGCYERIGSLVVRGPEGSIAEDGGLYQGASTQVVVIV